MPCPGGTSSGLSWACWGALRPVVEPGRTGQEFHPQNRKGSRAIITHRKTCAMWHWTEKKRKRKHKVCPFFSKSLYIFYKYLRGRNLEESRTKCQQFTTPGIRLAGAAAKSLQSCLTLCDPIDGSPPGSSVPGILQARTLEWAAISFSRD